MSITKSIKIARERGADDELILQKIAEQNPNISSQVSEAVMRGADASSILEEIKNQNITPEKETSFLKKVGDFFTGSTQKFAETLGTAAATIDPVVKKQREGELQETQEMIDGIIKRARAEEDKERAQKMLEAAQGLARAEEIDIFNNPEFQKTAKQILGEAGGALLEAGGLGVGGKIASGAKGATAGQTALRSAAAGGGLGAGFGAAETLQEGESFKEAGEAALSGAAFGAATGGVLGSGAGRALGKLNKKKLADYVGLRKSSAVKEKLFKKGLGRQRTIFRGESYKPTKKDLELAEVAQRINLNARDVSRDINKTQFAIQKEANRLKFILKKRGGIYNINNIKGQLRKMKDDKTADLIDAEVRVYDKMINKFKKIAQNKDNKGLDGLLEIRQEFDNWSISNNPNIFANKTGGAYRAIKAVRDSINDYINEKTGNDIVKKSLKKQSNYFDIIDNLAEKFSRPEARLKQARIVRPLKQGAKWGSIIIGGYLFGRNYNSSSFFD